MTSGPGLNPCESSARAGDHWGPRQTHKMIVIDILSLPNWPALLLPLIPHSLDISPRSSKVKLPGSDPGSECQVSIGDMGGEQRHLR